MNQNGLEACCQKIGAYGEEVVKPRYLAKYLIKSIAVNFYPSSFFAEGLLGTPSEVIEFELPRMVFNHTGLSSTFLGPEVLDCKFWEDLES